MKLSRLRTIKYGYHLALRYGRVRRWLFEKKLKGWADEAAAATSVSNAPPQLKWALTMMAGQANLPELFLAVASFTRHVGQPAQFMLASDGSLSESQARTVLSRAGLRVPAIFKIAVASPLGLRFTGSAASHPMMKKLFVTTDLISELTRQSGVPVLYVDTDVLFFPAAAQMDDILTSHASPAYMLDTVPTFDTRLLQANESNLPVNGGFLWLPKQLDWMRARQRIESLGPEFSPTHFTEQAAVHLAMHDSGGVPVDPDRFVLKVDDQFAWSDRYARRPSVICRHYVSTVRHKMWLHS